MKRRPGAIGGQQSGDPKIQGLRSRRHAQRAAAGTGKNLGPGLEEDGRGRLGVRQIPSLDPNSPTFTADLVRALQESGIMET